MTPLICPDSLPYRFFNGQHEMDSVYSRQSVSRCSLTLERPICNWQKGCSIPPAGSIIHQEDSPQLPDSREGLFPQNPNLTEIY